MVRQHMTTPGGDEPVWCAALEAALQSACDPQLFNDFVLAAQGDLFKWALSKLGNQDDALDVVQDVYLKVFKNYGQFDRSRGSPVAWVCGILHHAAVDLLRKRTAGARLMPVEVEGKPAPGPAAPDAVSWAMAWSAAWNRLTLEDQTVLELYFIDEIGTYQKCADCLEISLSTFNMRLHYAKQHFGELLKQQGIELPPNESSSKPRAKGDTDHGSNS